MASRRIAQADRRVYVVNQADPKVLTGATPVGANAVDISQFSIEDARADSQAANLRGSRTPSGNRPGPVAATWSLSQGLAGAGTPSTAPDMNPVFESLFGATSTAGSGTVAISSLANNAGAVRVTTSAAHGLSDGDFVLVDGTGGVADGFWYVANASGSVLDLVGSPGADVVTATGTLHTDFRTQQLGSTCQHLSIWEYVQPATARHRVVTGAIPGSMSVSINQNQIGLSVSGSGYWVLDSENFSSYDSIKQAGLGSFPAEPGTPTYVGGQVGGANFRASVDGVFIPGLLSANVRFDSGQGVSTQGANAGVPNGTSLGQRAIGYDLEFFDEDSNTAFEALYFKMKEGTKVPVMLSIYDGAGRSYGFYSPNVFPASPVEGGDGDKFIRFQGVAEPLVAGANDSFQMFTG